MGTGFSLAFSAFLFFGLSFLPSVESDCYRVVVCRHSGRATKDPGAGSSCMGSRPAIRVIAGGA